MARRRFFERNPTGIGLACALIVAGCGAHPGSPLPTVMPPPPRVVVVAVIDQLGSEVLERELTHLDPEGAIRRTIARGSHIHRVAYDFAATFTAPGHAAIFSGAPPRDSGIGSNRVYSRAYGSRLSLFDDGEHVVHGRANAHASPAALGAETIADVMQARRPESVVVAVAMKDRSAIVPGGQHPDLCLWFDARAGGFTTSSWYADALPEWLTAWRNAHPFGARMSPAWTPLDPAALETRFGRDDRSGEGAYGFDAAFPHDARGLEDADAFLSLPGSTEHLMELADEIVVRTGIGADHVPDLIAISIAATDYAGHAFGPESWEYADALYRSDRALGAFLARLERRAGPIGVLITSDHGVAKLPERSVEHGRKAYRVASETELKALRVVVDRALGARKGKWIEGWVQPYIYLAPGLSPADRERAIAAIAKASRANPGIARVYDARALAALEAPPGDPIDALVWRGIPRDPPGDVYVLPAEGSTAVEELPPGRGTSHGSAWDYDRQVPAIYAGPGLARAETMAVTPQCRVAGTIARLVALDPPAHACGALP